MNGIEDLGGAVEGGLIARAVEPEAGEAKDGHTHENRCLNCGTPLIGPYCNECGQRAHVHRTLGAFFHDLVHGVFHFEGKLWRTLPAIALRPGRMTRAYIEGQRARYVSPIALYLFVVFVTFAAFSMMGNAIDLGGLENRGEVGAQLQSNRELLGSLRDRRESLTQDAGPARLTAVREMYEARDVAIDASNVETYRRQALDALDRAIAIQQEDIATLEAMRKGGVVEAEFSEARAVQLENDGTFGPIQAAGGGDGFMDHAWKKAKANPNLLAYKLKNTAYKFGWLLIPISAPLVWLLFVFGSRRYPMYDHTVFVTYSISVSLFLVLFASILGKLGLESWTAIPALAMPIHMAVHFWGTYRQSTLGFILRLPALYLITFVALSCSCW
ncbi:DUF3667 domain-containing protein [Erythrobacter sp. 3-20A1M]|uniref:DUF3667 domain-containing protein n=1 Tax=Erythrobacter sp. 3-20A1M TaxID=2653850 RepID=UPI00203C8A23|nr:DUF3667 domain-containing protein [Erythrobacter sp. 3-20A1M]